MIVSFTTSPAELYHVNLALLVRTRAFWLWRAFFLFVLPGFFVGRSMADGWPFLDAVYLHQVYVGWMWAMVVFGTPLASRWQAWRIFRASPSTAGEMTYELTPDGVRVRTLAADALLRWEAFAKVAETRDFFLLYVGRNAHFLPKRVIAEEDLPALRALLRERITGSVRLHAAPAAA